MKRQPFSSEEIELYETRNDKYVIIGLIIGVVLAITLNVWEPDVEAIGTWIWTTFM